MGWKLADLEDKLLIGSTLVEGSTLSESQARSVLSGKTISGHPVAEIRELLNYRSAVEWLMQQLGASPYVSTDLIREFHLRLFQGFGVERGQWKAYENYTYRSDGTRFDYVPPADVPRLMSEWVKRFNLALPLAALPAQIAADLYFEFQRIHPFEDGNGRIGRIFIAYWIHRNFGAGFVFRLRDKLDHLRALEAAGRGEFGLLTQFFKKRIKAS